MSKPIVVQDWKVREESNTAGTPTQIYWINNLTIALCASPWMNFPACYQRIKFKNGINLLNWHAQVQWNQQKMGSSCVDVTASLSQSSSSTERRHFCRRRHKHMQSSRQYQIFESSQVKVEEIIPEIYQSTQFFFCIGDWIMSKEEQMWHLSRINKMWDHVRKIHCWW